ncbi:MAG: hypothetical protein AAF850_05680 [Pseudomonadota bacterium]
MTGSVPFLALGVGVILLVASAAFVALRIISSQSMARASLFNRLFVVVAVSSAFFSAVSSAIGFGLITGQESDDFLRNYALPPAFGLFVFFLTVAIWVGGAELVRSRDWFRGLKDARGLLGLFADGLHFVERCVKLFIVMPVLALILFFVSTWTSVVGIGGVDAVRFVYSQEIIRLQTECAGIVSYRRREFIFLDDLTLAINDVQRAARNERLSGGQSGRPGRGVASEYFEGVAVWLGALRESVKTLVDETRAGDPTTGLSAYDETLCARVADDLKTLLSANAFENYDKWARDFETPFEEFRQTLNTWRLERRIETLLDQQLASFDRANPVPRLNLSRPGEAASANAIEQYADEVRSALRSLVRKQRLNKPPAPLRSFAEISPSRGLAIVFEALRGPDTLDAPEPEKRPSRTLAVVQAERVAPLSTITPRDAVLKNFNVFSDVWALALSWDYASYILLLAYLFFPSAERSLQYKD